MKYILHNRTTGPTDLPPSVYEAINQPMISHRSEAFKNVFESTRTKMQRILNTATTPMFFTASGTGGLEAALVNTLEIGSRVLALSAGYYGNLFAAIAKKHIGNSVTLESFTPGSPIDADVLKIRLQQSKYDAVLLTHSESSTGVLNPLHELTNIIREHSDALIIVDAISSVGVTEFCMDKWGIDVAITVPQKALMAPPGLAIVSASERAFNISRSGNAVGSFYFDFSRASEASLKNQTPFTPGIVSIWGLDAALNLIEDEGYQSVFKRHRDLAKQCQDGVLSSGLDLFALEEYRTPGITSIQVPEDTSAKLLKTMLETEHGVLTATGIGDWEDRVLRIGHMGWVFEQDIQIAVNAIMQCQQSKLSVSEIPR